MRHPAHCALRRRRVSRGTAVGGEGTTRHIIVVDPTATTAEVLAARELASHLRQINGAEFVVHTNIKAPARTILVGVGTAARKEFADVPFDAFGSEDRYKTKGNRLVLAMTKRRDKPKNVGE